MNNGYDSCGLDGCCTVTRCSLSSCSRTDPMCDHATRMSAALQPRYKQICPHSAVNEWWTAVQTANKMTGGAEQRSHEDGLMYDCCRCHCVAYKSTLCWIAVCSAIHYSYHCSIVHRVQQRQLERVVQRNQLAAAYHLQSVTQMLSHTITQSHTQ